MLENRGAAREHGSDSQSGEHDVQWKNMAARRQYMAPGASAPLPEKEFLPKLLSAIKFPTEEETMPLRAEGSCRLVGTTIIRWLQGGQ